MSKIAEKVAAAYVRPTDAQFEAALDLVTRFAARWERPNADALRDLMHEDTQNLIPPMKTPGNREQVVEHFRGVLTRLPDLRLEIVRWAPVGDAVMVEWQATATVADEVLVWTGVDRFNIQGDKIYQGKVYWDTRGLAERMAEAVNAKAASA